jgi:hypothetical protein
MSRRHALTACLFNSLLVLFFAISVNAQSRLPTKFAVSSAQRSVGLREQIELRIRLLDQTGNEIAAPYNMGVTLIATRQKDIDTAKRDGKGNISVQRNGTLALPGGVNTVQTSITIHEGHSAASLQFSAHQVGPVRIYAENGKLVTGTTIIAIVDKSQRASRPVRRDDGAVFMLASMQEAQSPRAAATTALYQLVIEPLGEPEPELIGDVYVRRFSVWLMSEGAYRDAPRDIKVRLKVAGGGATLSQELITIRKNTNTYPSGNADQHIEVRTVKGGNIPVAAIPVVPVERDDLSVQEAPTQTFTFPTKIRAVKLQVEASRPAAIANGIESIKLTIRPVDAGNNPVSNREEGLEVRNIRLSLASRALGLKFENGETTIPLKQDDEFIETSVISSSPVAGAVIVAATVNGDQHTITGEQKLEFCFPWMSLGGAMFGGLMFPLVLTVFPGKQREQRFARGKLKMVFIYGLAGLFLGVMAFTVVFFGALGLSEFNFNGIPITIARLPIQNVLAACAIGFFGGVTLAIGFSIKEHKQAHAGSSNRGNESTAQA